MDLMHDWRALNEVLFHNQSLGQPFSGNTSSLVVLEDDGKIVDGIASNGRCFSDAGQESVISNKEKLDALASKYLTERVLVLSKKNIDRQVREAWAFGPNYFQQIASLRKALLEEIDQPNRAGAKLKGTFIISRRHFVLDLVGNHLKRVLPRRFNLLIYIDQQPGAKVPSYRAVVLSYKDGQVDQFFEPDFSSLHQDRLVNWQQETVAIGQYLESRYILPCYSLLMCRDDWARCLDADAMQERPWRLFARCYDEGRARIYPMNLITKALLATQRLMVYLARV